MANNTIKTRIQLKCDTEVNWNKSVLVADGGEKESGTSFIPLRGEVIIYSADGTHPFSRFKVGDGETNVLQLPFAGTHSINNLVFEETYNDFPPIGNINMLYIAIDTLSVYRWYQGNYLQLYGFERQWVSSVSSWDPGEMTELSVEDGKLNISNGYIPTLITSSVEVLTNYS